MLKYFYIFLLTSSTAFPQNFDYWQVFNEWESYESLFNNKLDFYFTYKSPHLRKTMKLLLNGQKKEAHKAFKKEYSGEWQYKIDTALIAYHFFQDQKILNREIERLKKIRANSTMLNQLARLMVYTGKIDQAKKLFLRSLEQAKTTEEVFEIARLSHLIKFRDGIKECFKKVASVNYSHNKQAFAGLKFIFARYANDNILAEKALQELVPIDGFYQLTSLYDLVPKEKALDFLLGDNYQAFAEYTYHKGKFLKIPADHIDKMLAKYTPKDRKNITDGFQPFNVNDKENEKSFAGIYMIAALGDKKRALNAFEKLERKIKTGNQVSRISEIEEINRIHLNKALLLLEIDRKGEALKCLSRIKTHFKYSSEWSQHPITIDYILKLQPKGFKDRDMLDRLDARMTLNQKEEVLNELKIMRNHTDDNDLFWLAERITETGSFEKLTIDVLKDYLSKGFDPSLKKVTQLGYKDQIEKLIDFDQNKLTQNEAGKIREVICNTEDPVLLKSLMKLCKLAIDTLSNPELVTIKRPNLFTYTARSYFLNNHKNAVNFLMGAEEIAEEDGEWLNIAHTYITFTKEKSKALDILKKIGKPPKAEDCAKMAECYYLLNLNKEAKKYMEAAIKKDRYDGDYIQRLKFLYYDGFKDLKIE